MAELIGCRECDSPSCKGCNIKILADMLNRGKLNALMNKNRCIDGSVDAAPVVHGEWIETPYDYNKPTPSARFSCSKCGRRTGYRQSKTFNYCPNCGAKMDGGNNAEE